MLHGKRTDYMHPFMDRTNQETTLEAIERVVSIGLEPLKAWYGRVRKDTHPGTFGDSGSELAGSVAYLATGGKVMKQFADEDEPKFEIARRLGIEVNWV